MLTLVFQLLTLPSLAPRQQARTASVLDLLRRPGIAIGMLACVLAHGGQFVLFTFIRPALEGFASIDMDGLALLMLGFGLANFVGTLLAGWLMERSLRVTLVVMPALVGLAAWGMVVAAVQFSIAAGRRWGALYLVWVAVPWCSSQVGRDAVCCALDCLASPGRVAVVFQPDLKDDMPSQTWHGHVVDANQLFTVNSPVFRI